MNPGLVVKLRPAGPWRIGPDSGARNRVDFIYHSDSLYSAVTSAMARLGSLEEWLEATARNSSPAVCFSSCFPFLDEIGFVVPPRTIWPPASPAFMSGRVRWKSARFVPLGIVQAILAGQHLDENQWAVDGASECLVPAGRPGPFRTSVRWNAAVDRLTGAVERHSTACIEFRPGSGLWTIVSFRDEDAREQWADRVKAAFRLLADTGFGGERSRGWGRAEAPEFIEGSLPEMILPDIVAKAPVEPPVQEPPVEEPPVPTPPMEEPPAEPEATEIEEDRMTAEGDPQLPPPEQNPVPAIDVEPKSGETIEENRMTAEGDPQLPPPDPDPEPPSTPEPPAPNPAPEPPPGPPPLTEPMQAESIAPTPNLSLAAEGADIFPASDSLAPGPRPPAPEMASGFWLLSLFTPAADDTVDWARGNYTVLARGGRVDSPAGSGELKKQVQMIAEGSVLHAAAIPRGTAADVAPDGFAHPVFRAGFALSIPLPGREGNRKLMRYRLTCLTPLLVGDGRKLSPIDYMVWKDHVNVLDQWRIFRLLAKGPRLEGYLNQLKTAEKLDFASWGGFAQNFAGRRIPFESAAYSAYWNRAAGESLHIPTFAAGASGPYLPATAIKGALRTGMVFANWRDGLLQDTLARVNGERLPRRPSEPVEDQALGQGGSNKMKLIGAGDSNPVATGQFKIYLLRTSTLQARGPNFTLGWKQSPRGAVDGARPDDSTPVFAEMATPGSSFEGAWDEHTFFLQPDVRRSIRWPESFNRAKIFESVNIYAQGLLSLHRQYASSAGLGLLDRSLDELEQKLAAARAKGSCLLSLGWGAGLPAKSAWLDTTNPDYRQILEAYGFYDRALASGLPFPKTRRVVFLNNKPATLPGWAELEVV